MDLITAILLGIIISCTVFVSLISSLGFWKRESLRAPSISFLLNAVAEICGGFSNAVFCTLVFTGIFENLILLVGFGFRVDSSRGWFGDWEFVAWLLAAFVCKIVHILWIFYRQCSLDIFILDWEQTAKNDPGCIWRTYFVASELLRLQTFRKISPILLFSVAFLCITLIPGIFGLENGRIPGTFGLENLKVLTPLVTIFGNYSSEVAPSSGSSASSGSSGSSGSIVFVPHFGPYYVFTISSVTLSVIAVVIYVAVVVRDRFFGNRVREFIDVCCWLNCSIFFRSHRGFAYYVHGKSVHPTAEFGFGNLVEMIRNEEANLVSRRGLNSESEIQSFSFALPPQFDVLHRQVLAQLTSDQNASSQFPKDDGTHISFINSPFSTPLPADQSRSTETFSGNKKSKKEEPSLLHRAKAHDLIGQFLRRFLDHGFKEADYVIRWRNFFESFFDVETGRSQTTGKGNGTGTGKGAATGIGTMFYDPKMTFTEFFFIGRTFDLFVFEALLFSVVAIHTTNYAFALVAVFLVNFFLSKIRAFYGHAHLTKKAFVYRRFLL